MKRFITGLQLAALSTCVLGAAVANATIYGTLSNFDVYNNTNTNAYGAEIELEGLHSGDVYYTFPAHYSNKSTTEYQDGALYGVRIKYSGYNFNGPGYLAPTVGQSTNGHACVNLPGCEHFGFALRTVQPTATRYYWLDEQGQRIGNSPMAIPTPTWTYNPPVNGGDPVVRAEIEVPEAEHQVQRPDALWVKIFKTEIPRPVRLGELMSDDPIMQDELEVEMDWDLLEGRRPGGVEDKLGGGNDSVIRRYEFYKYMGAYNDEHEPVSAFDSQNLAEPPAGELGDFIAANMVAVNLAPFFLADVNGDEVVDGADAGAIFSSWGAGPAGDLNADHVVDGADIAIVYGEWTGDGSAGVVPEPLACGWAIAVSIVCVARRRR